MTEIGCRLHFHETPKGSQRERERTEAVKGHTNNGGVETNKNDRNIFLCGRT